MWTIFGDNVKRLLQISISSLTTVLTLLLSYKQIINSSINYQFTGCVCDTVCIHIGASIHSTVNYWRKFSHPSPPALSIPLYVFPVPFPFPSISPFPLLSEKLGCLENPVNSFNGIGTRPSCHLFWDMLRL